MSDRPRSWIRVLCALLALTLGLPAFFAAPEVTADGHRRRAANKPACCCGPSDCCAARSPCCVKENDRKAPDSGTPRTAPAPEPRLAVAHSTPATRARVLAAPAPRAIALVSSPAEDRLHLRQSVFRT